MSDLVPDGWRVSTLESNSTLITDGSHFSPVTVENGFPIATVQNMRDRSFDISSCRLISEEKFDELERGNCLPLIGDVLFSKDGTIGKTFVFQQKSKVVLLSSIAIIRLQQDKLNPNYCTQYLQSPLFYKQLENAKSGSAIRRVVLKDIKQLRLPTPPLPEQQKIAKILTAVDEVIEKTQAQIDKLKDLKTGMMQELLTNGIGHTKFKDSPVGRIPAEWEVGYCRELTKVITKGTTPTTLGFKYTETGINFIKVESIISNGNINKNKFSYICDEANKAMSRSVINTGDILITIAGATVGKLAIVGEEHLPANTNQALAIVRSDIQKVNRKFLFYWLQSQYIVNNIFSIQTVGAQPNLSLAQIGDFLVPMPDLEEQMKIVEILDSADDNLKLKTKKLKQYTQVKKALMQDLLTGKVRVKVESTL